MPPSSASPSEKAERTVPSEWRLRSDPPALVREFRFKTFRQAFAFMTEVALAAERANHHPDWSNSYNRVTIALSTHSEKRVTEKDEALARKIDSIYDHRS